MTKLVDKLSATQCPCDALAGKTISKAICERGYYYLLFSDGTWCHTDYSKGVDQILEDLQGEDPECDPLVEFGLCSSEEESEHWKELEKEWDEAARRSRKFQYERLKEEFENPDNNL